MQDTRQTDGSAASPADESESRAEVTTITVVVPPELAGRRLDQIAATVFPDYSRARLQTWIRDASLRVNGQPMRPKDKVLEGDALELSAPIEPESESESEWDANALPLDIVFEDAHLLVINKAPGTVVHPAVGNRSGTLLNGLLNYCPELSALPRAGIVHRLDKETSGLMVVAKTLKAHHGLVRQLQARTVSRIYEAVVCGVLTGGGRVDAPIGRHPVHRKKQAVTANGKTAVTHYRVAERFRAHTLLRVKLETGRTHQIRVHMGHIRHPLVGDPVYGGRLLMPAGVSPALAEQLRQFKRQALHAFSLGFDHPDSGQPCAWEVPAPSDMQQLIDAMRADNLDER